MQLGDQNNLFKYGRMTLQMNTDNIDGLAVMTVATARTIDPVKRADAATKEKSVEEWAARCISALQVSTKPDGVSDADFARSRDGKLAMCYSGLGQTRFVRRQSADAVKDSDDGHEARRLACPIRLTCICWAWRSGKQAIHAKP